MLPIARKNKIKEIIIEKKSVTVNELTKLFKVTEETIRRDLKQLEDEGFLTKTRSKLVNRAFLTKLTNDMGLGVFIDSNTTKNIDNSHIYGDALEALIGAIYLDKGYHAAKYFITKKILSNFVNLAEIEQNDLNFKSRLIEWSQKNKKELEFETSEEFNEKSKQPKFTTVVIVDNKKIGFGTGTSKKEAHQNAARIAINKLEDL